MTTERFERVLFLDVDGVFNSLRSFVALGGSQCFDPVAVRLLEMLISECELTVVWSTAWRGLHGWDGGNILRVLGQTPMTNLPLWERVMRNGEPLQTPDLSGRSRGAEIQSWLSGADVGDFVILDDDDDMGELSPYLVKTEFETGLCHHHAEEISKRFGVKLDTGWAHKSPPTHLEFDA